MVKVKVDLKTVYDLENPPFQKCPYCGCEEFYIRQRMTGLSRTIYRFDGGEADNGEMYSGLRVSNTGIYAYCGECNKKLFRYRASR